MKSGIEVSLVTSAATRLGFAAAVRDCVRRQAGRLHGLRPSPATAATLREGVNVLLTRTEEIQSLVAADVRRLILFLYFRPFPMQNCEIHAGSKLYDYKRNQRFPGPWQRAAGARQPDITADAPFRPKSPGKTKRPGVASRSLMTVSHSCVLNDYLASPSSSGQSTQSVIICASRMNSAASAGLSRPIWARTLFMKACN